MGLRVAKAVVGVKEEGTAFTFDAPAAANCFPAFDVSYSVEGDAYQRQEAREIFDKLDSIPGPQSATLAFKQVINGSGTAGTAGHLATSFLGCGMGQEDNVGTPSIDYKPYSPPFDSSSSGSDPIIERPYESVSCAFFIDGLRLALKGGVGNVKFVLEMGQPMILEFEFKGAFVAAADVAVPTPSGVNSTTPPTFLSAGLTSIGSVSLPFTRVEYDMGNEIVPVQDANDASGIKGYEIVNRRIVGTVDFETPLVATDPLLAQWSAGTTGAISTGTIGSTSGNQHSFTAGRCQYNSPSLEERDGRHITNMSFDVVSASGASEGDSFSYNQS